MNFFEEKFGNRIIFLDGATGSCLVKRGMPGGVCPEQWILEHEDIFLGLQEEYVSAGSDILYAPTFGGNRIKLAEYGLEDRLKEINTRLVQLSKRAAAGKALVAGDVTMTGRQLEPVGNMPFEEVIDIYKEQIKVLAEAGCDMIAIETMMSLQETRAAVIACKEVCSLPILATLSFEKNGRTLFGTDPVTAAVVLEGLGVSAIGANCSTGPDKMALIIQAMRDAVTIPVVAKPNAGMPHVDANNETVYDMPPEEFGEAMEGLVKAGARIVGGCCGTSPEYIREIHEKNFIPVKALVEDNNEESFILTSERMHVRYGGNNPFRVIGERINPTGKKKLKESLVGGSLDLCLEYAKEQEEAGAEILDVNLGMSGIDEKEMFLKLLSELSMVTNLPLSLDSSDCDVLEAALRVYPGRALVNSVSLEKDKADRLFPLIKKYGAAYILLPLSEGGLPKDYEEKIQNIETLLQKAEAYGLGKRDVVVDALVTTVSANPAGAIEAMETVAYCSKKRIPTTCGLSNISFGLPERGKVNTAFLSAAIAKGLTLAIANPCTKEIMDTVRSMDLLMNKEDGAIHYIEHMTKDQPETDGVEPGQNAKQRTGHTGESDKSNSNGLSENKEDCNPDSLEAVRQGVLKGNEKSVVESTKNALENHAPEEIMNEALMPAIDEVGKRFNEGRYFLPQLIASANAMKAGIDILEPLFQKEDKTGKSGKICIATVKGDIHDIGKNLVVLMLKNYGYEVHDLGKDVETSAILDFAEKEDVDIIALSALMTTTMIVMKDVVEGVKERNLRAKVIIGGAVITQEFADEIGADGYSPDAADCVRLVERILDKQEVLH